MKSANPQADGFFRKPAKWREELRALRTTLQRFPLDEAMKWRLPCYSFQNGNVVIMQAFKEYCALLFFKGALLKDPKRILVAPGEHTQAGRQIRFSSQDAIARLQPVVKAYIREAIALEKAGVKVPLKKAADFAIPEELQRKFEELPALKAAFDALTPGRRKAYVLYVSGAKQAKTREARVEKHLQRILNGKGIDDE